MLKKCAILSSAFLLQAQAIEQTWDEDIAQLKSASLKERIQSGNRLWAAGEGAIATLEKALRSAEPEIALRASDILDKIKIGFKPDDPPELLSLAENFYRESEKKQSAIINQLFQQKKYSIVHLLAEYAKSENDKNRLRSISVVRGCAVLQARMLIAAGKIDEAEAWLRRCVTTNPRNQNSLAYLLVAQGRFEEELKIASQQQDPASKAMQMALYRVSGNYQETLRLAKQENSSSLAAFMEILLGNPLPYLQNQLASDSLGKSYLAVAESIRNAEKPDEEHINSLAKAANSDDDEREEKYRAVSMLLALGLEEEAATAMKSEVYLKANLFLFYALQERDEDVIRLLELDPQKPDYSTYVTKEIEVIVDDENYYSTLLPYLICWLERRGQWEVIDRDIVPHFAKLSKTDPEIFDYMTQLMFYAESSDSPYYAPQTVIKIREKIAPDDDLAWQELLKTAFGNTKDRRVRNDDAGQNEALNLWWIALKEWNPDLALVDRFRLLMQVFRMIPDSKNAREAVMRKIIQWHEAASPEQREEKMQMFSLLQSKAPTPLLAGICEPQTLDPIGASVQNKQWEKATELLLKAAEAYPENPLSLLHASICQHFAGNAKAADELLQRFRTLVLGDSQECLRAAQLYATYNMVEPALEWNQQAIALCPSGSSNIPVILDSLAHHCLETGKWSVSSAAFEAILAYNLRKDSELTPQISLLYTRNDADLAQGLSFSAKQREKCLKMLKKSHQSNLANAGLADDFFPCLRRAGLTQEHNDWFEESWQAMDTQHKRYPTYDNIANSMAWLAARAKLRLPEAEELSHFSLSRRPEQAAYLDTMAEIHFANGDRKAALEWSTKALFMEQQDNQLFRQHFRFFFAPLP